MALSPERTLALLDRSLRWARDRPAQPGRALIYAMVEDWSDHGRLRADDSATVSVWIDEKEFFDWEVEELDSPDALRAGNPSCLIFRIVEEDGARQALAFIRNDCGLSSEDIANALGHGVLDPEANRIDREARSAQVKSSESTRKPGAK